MRRSIATALAAIAMIAALAAVTYLGNTENATVSYVRVDDALARPFVDEGGDGELWEYELEACDAAGARSQVVFTAHKRLRDGAFLMLRSLPIRGVVSWEEVSIDELPQAAREQLEDAGSRP